MTQADAREPAIGEMNNNRASAADRAKSLAAELKEPVWKDPKRDNLFPGDPSGKKTL